MTSFDVTLKSRVIMHMITSTARGPNASTRSEPVECSCTSIRQGAWCLSARAAGNGRVIDELMTMGSVSFAFAGEPPMVHPVPFR